MDIHEFLLDKNIDPLTKINENMICDLIEEYALIVLNPPKYRIIDCDGVETSNTWHVRELTYKETKALAERLNISSKEYAPYTVIKV